MDGVGEMIQCFTNGRKSDAFPVRLGLHLGGSVVSGIRPSYLLVTQSYCFNQTVTYSCFQDRLKLRVNFEAMILSERGDCSLEIIRRSRVF